MTAISSFGITLNMGDGATPTEAFSAVAEVKDITPFKLKATTKETTSHSSSGGWKTFKSVLIEGGECSFKINFLPTAASHSFATGLAKDLISRTTRHYQIILPDTDATTYEFSAHVTEFSPDGPVEGILETEVTLEITGSVVEQV